MPLNAFVVSQRASAASNSAASMIVRAAISGGRSLLACCARRSNAPRMISIMAIPPIRNQIGFLRFVAAAEGLDLLLHLLAAERARFDHERSGPGKIQRRERAHEVPAIQSGAPVSAGEIVHHS